jgi:hypothetical protein
MNDMTAPSRFSFVDEGETLRRLGIDRDTLLSLVAAKRLRAYPGVGKGNFYRIKDVDALYAELHADAAREALAEGAPVPAGRKVFDPAYKVHVRLQADLKWYDLEDEELQAWIREMHPDGYQRQRTNITMVMGKLQRLLDLMDEAAANWKHLAPPESAATEPPQAPASRPARKSLQMFPAGGASTPPAPAASPAPTPPPAKPKRKPLQMFAGTPQQEQDS